MNPIGPALSFPSHGHAPRYVHLWATGELGFRVRTLNGILDDCVSCPRCCRVDRPGGELGHCRIAASAVIETAEVEFEAEPCFSGENGAGIVRFKSGNLRDRGSRASAPSAENALPDWEDRAVNAKDLGDLLLAFQEGGRHVVVFHSSSHVVPQLAAGLAEAVSRGFCLPVVYGSDAYDSTDTLRLLEGIIDIYLPRIRSANETIAPRLTGVKDYVDASRAALREMVRQRGALRCDANGIAESGVLVRLSWQGDDLEDTAACLAWIASDFGTDVGISLLEFQARPLDRPKDASPSRPDTGQGHPVNAALDLCEEFGFRNVLIPGV
jgi:putative pyruvate formate lyase activating enzyme